VFYKGESEAGTGVAGAGVMVGRMVGVSLILIVCVGEMVIEVGVVPAS
jgi:hypothetical protein